MRKTLGALVVVGALALAGCDSGGGDDAESNDSGTTIPPGLDSSFGNNGVANVALSTTGGDRFLAVQVASDGSIYAAGYVTEGTDQSLALARFSSEGKPDTSFGTNGVATVNASPGGKAAEVARSLVLQSDGKVVIVGAAEHAPTATGDAAKDTDAVAARFDSSGKIDTTFGQSGVARLDFGAGRAISETSYVGDSAWGAAGLPNGKVAVFGTKLAAGANRTDADYVLAGLTASGALDPSFGTNGTTTVDVNASGDSARNVIVQSDGKVVATGYSRDGDGVVFPVIVRASATGQLDTTFGQGGVAAQKVMPGGVAESYAVGQQGSSYISAGYGRGADAAEKVDMLSYRFGSTGTWDTAYGQAGIARVDLAKEDDRARNLVVLPDDRVFIAGSGKLTAANVDAAVFMLTPNGQPDTSFGEAGHILSDLGGPADSWYGVALTADEEYAIVAGYKGIDATSGGNDDAVLGRIKL